MKWDCILLRYGELALKGKNRRDFERQLMRNIRKKLNQFDVTVRKELGRLFVDLNDQDTSSIIRELQEIFGLIGLSPALRVSSQIEEIEKAVLKLVHDQEKSFRTFKVKSKRADKSFLIHSDELNRQIGSLILRNTENKQVDVHKPDLNVHIEVRSEATYIYGNDIAGAGGLPVGSSGSVALLLSGGIDSPVAGYLTLKRGAKLSAIHFHSYPYTSERAKQKVIDLAQILSRYAGEIELHLVPFTEIQTEIRKHCAEAYSITIMRRFMMRIAEGLAKKHGYLALVTGESLGQVASQTLESMNTIHAVSGIPTLRPVIGMDKLEIMDIAKQIGTYETSILPYEDCCTIFLPQSPKTKPNLQISEREESNLAVDELVNQAISKTKQIKISADESEEFSYF